MIATGLDALNGSDLGFVFYNSQHVTIDNVKIYSVNTGLTMIGQNTHTWVVGNSEVSGLYILTYTKSAANSNNTKPGIDVSSTGTTMNLVTFTRPQVNTYNGYPNNGDGTGFQISLKNVVGITMSAIDTECASCAVGVKMVNAVGSYLQFTSAVTPLAVSLDSTSTSNTITSLNNAANANIDPAVAAQNIFPWNMGRNAFCIERGGIWCLQQID